MNSGRREELHIIYHDFSLLMSGGVSEAFYCKTAFWSIWAPKWGFSRSWGPTVCMPLYDNAVKFPQLILKSKSYIVFTTLDAFLGRNFSKKAFWSIWGPKLGLFRTMGPNYVYAVVRQCNLISTMYIKIQIIYSFDYFRSVSLP